MNPLEDHERKVIIEFCHLLEKSKQLFNGLRELPQYGHKQWHSYFGRTFDVYTKLWKFQQQHRLVLDNKYGLKRWQIGEIASKIGQLYYHFYLRTSETGYLSEAFSFYSAIRGRSYYTQASKSDKCELMVKKLRYYARFIVVCLLLKKLALVRELIKELDKQIIEYGATYDPDDQIEWTVVMDEVKAFIVAEAAVTVLHPDNYPIVLSHRLNIMSVPPPERPSVATLKLQEAVIVGSVSQQVKFSELTMDMYRILQTLEWEPTGEMPQVYNESPRYRYASAPLINKGYNHDGIIRNENPHKYLLFKPSAAQVLVYLASGCYDLPNNGALLLYISADALIVPASKITEDTGYDVGGLMTNVKSDLHRERERERDRERARERGRDRERERDRDRERDRERDRDRVWERERDRERELDCDRERDRERNRERNRERERDRERDQDREQDGERGERDREDASREPRPTQSRSKDPQCIHPGDLYPFTRCPLFIIVDSDNSYIFQNIPRHFAQPLIVLMSPLEVPNTFPPDYRKEGSLFTLFLHSPLSAFCYCCDIKTVPLVQWERSQTYIEAFNIEAAQVMLRHRIDTAFISFMSDDFLRLLLLRFMFCAVALRMHRGFRSRNQLPRSSPPLPDDLLEHPTLVHIVMDLAVHLQVRSHFHDSSGPPTSN
ncbi:PREDICTED: protein SCAI [Papilio polytes]|uniref:protein SCAI n=1 Tax=Papilio polytes TaxID=76194 RepID=UPI000675FD41|nr:PREDICTED: protein SCAI [Papilio polytes]